MNWKKWKEANTEIVIEYRSSYSKGTMIIDTNYFSMDHKKIMKKLKDVEIISMVERRKENNESI